MSEEILKEQKENLEAAEAAGEAAKAAETAEAAEPAAEAAEPAAEAAEPEAEAAEAAEPAAETAEPTESMEDMTEELEKSYKEFDKKNTRAFVAEDSPNAERWEELRQMMEDKTVVSVKIKEIVKGGAIAFVDETKAFIPASQISLSYVEKLEEWVGRRIDTYIITVDPEKKRLVLSARELLKERREAERKEKLAAFKVGDIVEGVVESIKDYGAFVKLDEGVSGLLHVSQISRQRIKHPGVVLKEGQSVKAKIRDVADGKISLSMKALEEDDERPSRDSRPSREPREPREEKSDFHYKNSSALTTGLGELLKGIKL